MGSSDGGDLGAMISDLSGLGKVGEALLKTLSKAVGGVVAPGQIRRVGYAQTDVEADRIVRIAEAEAMAQAVREGRLTLSERAGARLVAREIAHQGNLEATLIESARVLKDDPDFASAEGAEPEADWMDAYFRYAENISEARVRAIWARVLAAQISASRRRISLATLDSLRLLEAHQARAFERMAKAWSSFGSLIDISRDDGADFSIYEQDNLALQGLGLAEIIAKREYYLQGKGFAFVFSRNPAPDLNDIPFQDVEFAQIRPSWRGLELCDALFPSLIEWDPRSANHLERVPDLGPWAAPAVRAEILAEWVSALGSMAKAVLLGRHASTELQDGVSVRSQSVFTHIWTSADGWRRLPSEAGDDSGYPPEIRLMLGLG